jgi:hypothetical protein
MGVAEILAIGGAVYALASEIIGLKDEWESNSVVQVVMSVFGKIFGK